MSGALTHILRNATEMWIYGIVLLVENSDLAKNIDKY